MNVFKLSRLMVVNKNSCTFLPPSRTPDLCLGRQKGEIYLRLRNAIILLAALLVLSHPAKAQMLTGSYTGDGNDDRSFNDVLGFQPDVVIIKADDAFEAVARTATMSGDNAKELTTASGLTANLIQSLDADGFTVGDDDRVNKDTVDYYWSAFKATSGEVAVGAYTGIGGDNRSIDISDTSVSSDFQPDYVIMMPADNGKAGHRSSFVAGDNTLSFGPSNPSGNMIQAFETTGFQVGSSLNQSGVVYHYVAWKVVAGKMAVGSYLGDDNDDRDITGVGFEPEYLLIKGDDNREAVQHPASLGPSTDATLDFADQVQFADAIQDLDPGSCSNCFQVGTETRVNDDPNGPQTREYFWMAFARQAPPTAVTLRSLKATASRAEDGVRLQWRTGHEVDNLGFHVYREVDGKRVRLTSSMIAGSALLTGPGASLSVGRSYSWWDPTGTEADRYWLQDVDLNGQRTWHGVVTPTVVSQSPPLRTQGQTTLLSKLGITSAGQANTAATQHTTQGARGHRRARRHYGAPRLIASQGERQDWERHGLPAHAIQRALAAAAAVKLTIREAGWYRVTQPELVAAGLDPDIDPRHLQLFVAGRQQRLLVVGEGDGRFDSQDAIEFYAEGRNTPWSDSQIYWLVAGSRSGKRVPVVPSRGRRPAAPSFPFTVEHRQRTLYFAALKNGEAENFFGAVVATEPVEQTLILYHVDLTPPEDARLQVALQGVTAGPHQVTILLNGYHVDTVFFRDQSQQRAELAIPHSWLQEGANLVTLMTAGDETDVSLVDTIRLTYWHTFTAQDDALHFTVTAEQQVMIGGFRSPQIRVVDITWPAAVQEVMGQMRLQEAGYAIMVSAPRPGSRTLLAFTEARVRTPASVMANVPSTWHQGEGGADLVIITHGDFLSSLAPLQTARQAQGWAVGLIDVEDLYDEFNFGHKNPLALRDFLQHAATTWSHPPRFVLLVGDASFDPRNYLGLGDVDLLPTQLVQTAVLETASDDWLADFDDDGVPELAVGRLPVRSAAEADTVVAKLLQYADASADRWTQDVLLVADNSDSFDFAAASAEIAALLPAAMTVEKLFLDQTDTDSARRTLLARLNAGQLLVNYTGHGSVGAWSGAALLTSADAGMLTNGVRLPVVVAMNCLNGFFHDLYSESLAEALLTAQQGGAVAVWASSGLTNPAAQAVMNQALVAGLFGEQTLTLGEAVVAAKAAMTDPDVRRTWLLFGDPSIRLK
jgi:hypothetical protein